jgi:hypothetical protein
VIKKIGAEMEQERERITNRHIAKVLSRLAELNLPAVVQDEIKRQMWFLSDDLKDMWKQGICDGEQKE